MYTVLICDDELRIREVISEYFKLDGFNVVTACDGYQAIERVKEEEIHCIILDIMMPRMNGFDALKKIKEIKDIPVIMLSARTDEEDKLLGFNNGIDDYVTKPFSPSELLARSKAIIQRYNKHNVKNDYIQYEGIYLNRIEHVVLIDDKNIKLTNKEYDLLLYFLTNPNKVISRNDLLNNVWDNSFNGNDRTIDAHIKMLRKSIYPYSETIKTIRGVGYKFVKEEKKIL